MEMVSISKRRIAVKKTETIAASSDVTVALWLEQGSIEVLAELDGEVVARIESEGCVPLRGKALHLRNTGRTPATVFVAMGSVSPAAALPPPPAAPPRLAAAPPKPAAAPSKLAAAPPPPPQMLAMAERGFQQPTLQGRSAVKKYNVFCSTNSHGLLNETPLSNAKAVALQDEHIAANAECADCTRIRPA